MRRRVGEAVAAGYRCFSPPVDDLSAYVELGTVEPRIPVRVFRPVAEADLRILIGSVLPHLQAGFGGGYKLIFPGTSHRSTLGALHRQGLVGRVRRDRPAGRRRGREPDAPHDPRRGRPAGPLLVDQPPDRRARADLPRRSPAGPRRVQDLLAAEARRRFQAPRGRAGRHRHRRQSPLAGRPDAELQGALAPPRGLPARRRARRPVLDRPRGDRPVVSHRRAAADRRRPGPSAPGPSAGWSRPPSTSPPWPARRPPS